MSLTIDIQNQDIHVLFKVNGVLDITTIDVFSSKIDEIPSNFSSLVIDLSNLEFIDSTGIGAIMELIYLAQEKRFKIHLEGMDETTKQIFEIVGLFTILEALQKERL
ncbi:hypothetical protein DNHGIG_11040 [Collibacillus ludicampi]|uniref:Anti-sigma factor antagonist n=1 Tax=Collibacillus ludicampi TaxID=2771369 RepID=A0AAV4LCS5_9BACL|nr:STAS domain-containing protein [Collibacillus ludicampi]GIM45555.1 hypothetical protein DNHGIG_11040 [Collibacillus ludicampi]